MPTASRKIRRQRGSRTHGWGQVGQHRKSGGRGGKGKAGLHKHKWTWTVKYDPKHFGVKGFVPLSANRRESWINVGQLDGLAGKMSEGRKRSGRIRLDLKSLGFRKLLGAGSIKGAYEVLTGLCTSSAKEKVESAGGNVVLG